MKTRIHDPAAPLIFGLALTGLLFVAMVAFSPSGLGPAPQQAATFAPGTCPVQSALVFRVDVGSGWGSAVPVAQVGELCAFLTCKHVVRDSAPFRVRRLGGDFFEVLASEQCPDADAALVWVRLKCEPVSLRESPVVFGEQCFTSGYPASGTLTVTYGFFGETDPENGPTMSSPIWHGNSGGAVLDASGHLVGLARAMYTEYPNVAIPHLAIYLPNAAFESWMRDALSHLPKLPAPGVK